MSLHADVNLILEHLKGRRCGRGWIACCPAHDDRRPSLSIAVRDGRILVPCHSGCDQRAVIDALRQRGLWPDRHFDTRAYTAVSPKQRRQAERYAETVADWLDGVKVLIDRCEPLVERLIQLLVEAELDEIAAAITPMLGIRRRFANASPAALAEAYSQFRDLRPKTAGRIERTGRENRIHAEAITVAIVRILELAELSASRTIGSCL